MVNKGDILKELSRILFQQHFVVNVDELPHARLMAMNIW